MTYINCVLKGYKQPSAKVRISSTNYLRQARICTPQPECTFFEGDCTYCPAGYKCPQVRFVVSCRTPQLNPHPPQSQKAIALRLSSI